MDSAERETHIELLLLRRRLHYIHATLETVRHDGLVHVVEIDSTIPAMHSRESSVDARRDEVESNFTSHFRARLRELRAIQSLLPRLKQTSGNLHSCRSVTCQIGVDEANIITKTVGELLYDGRLPCNIHGRGRADAFR